MPIDDDEVQSALTPLIERLNAFAVKRAETIWKLHAPTQVTVKNPNETYRKVTMTDQEFFLTGVREGKRDKLIFEFAPVDTQPFIQMELNDKEIEKVLDLESQLMDEVLGGNYLAAAIRREIKAHATASKHKAAEKQVAIKEEQHVKYSDLRDWGSW